MRLLLDECIGDRSLRDALAAAGHDVVRSVDELGGGVDDHAIFAYAREHERIIVTYNNIDFKRLGDENPEHPGMLLLYQDNEPTDMKTSDIVKALSNVENTYSNGIAGEMVVLNGYQW